MFTIGETRPNRDANEPKEDAQGTRQIRRGRLNNKTQREQRRRRTSGNHRAKTKDNITSNQLSTCGVLGTSKDTFTSGNVIKEVVVEYRNHNGGP